MKAKTIHANSSAGFTIVELMIATIIFSIILLGATAAIIQVGRMYYKGVIVAQTQETSRRVMDSISRPIQFAGTTPREVPPTSIGGIQTGALCIDDQRYTYGINAQVNDTVPNGSYSAANHRARHALWQDTLSSANSACTALNLTQASPSDGNTKAGTTGKEVLAQNMRLARFTVSASGNIWSIDAMVIYGDDDLLLPDGNNPTGCGSLAQSAQWCAVSSLNTQVYKRINPQNN